MLPQYLIILGARSALRSDAAKAGRFESEDYANIERIVRERHGFEGCTIIRANGFYQGQQEDTVQIVILEENYQKIRDCAQELRKAFKQNSVLVVSAGVGEFLS
ncbi:MAG TPA: hypothetical protein VKY92_22820 [Verrucomicrobiae bacterium]|nr:hypothetical protein [Verrucomicrobiae bacterium]